MLEEHTIATAIEQAIEESEDDSVTLLEVVKRAVPLLAEESIKEFCSFLVNGKRVDDWSVRVTNSDVVKVIPLFAGGM